MEGSCCWTNLWFMPSLIILIFGGPQVASLGVKKGILFDANVIPGNILEVSLQFTFPATFEVVLIVQFYTR